MKVRELRNYLDACEDNATVIIRMICANYHVKIIADSTLKYLILYPTIAISGEMEEEIRRTFLSIQTGL